MPKVRRQRWYVYDGELVPLSDLEWQKYGREIKKHYSTFAQDVEDDEGESATYEQASGLVQLSPSEDDDVQIPLPQMAAKWQAEHGITPTSTKSDYVYDESEWTTWKESREEIHEREMRTLLIALAEPRKVEGYDDVDRKEPRHFGYS